MTTETQVLPLPASNFRPQVPAPPEGFFVGGSLLGFRNYQHEQTERYEHEGKYNLSHC
jgi:hypothetical protein